jgi:hypothetical protein
MNEKESNFPNDGQNAPTPRTGLRASNTLETIRPQEIVNTYLDQPASNEPLYQRAPMQGRGLPPEQYNLLPVDWPTVQETAGLPKEFVELSLTQRVEYLEARNLRSEERIDGILDRLALYNVKSSHKI